MTRRQGMTLVELLAMMAILAAMMAVLTPLFNGLLKNTPRLYHDSAANTQLSKILRQMRLDALTAQTAQINEDAETHIFSLSLTHPGRSIHYSYDPADEVFTRREISDDAAASNNENSWSLEQAVFSGEIKKHGAGQILIIRSGFQRRRSGAEQLALANTHIFCIGGENPEDRL